MSKSAFHALNPEERMLLMRFVCSFAWADFEIRDEERRWISALITRLELGDDERAQVDRWLERPPPAESIDPGAVPVAQRELFLTAIESLIRADGDIAPEEADSFEILRQLVR